MKLRKNKKGFTIIELVIVIAVIGVLTAVLVPVFINLTNKANEASDQSLVKNLNTALKMEEQTEGHKKSFTLQGAIDDLYAQGYLLENLIAKSGQDLLWDQEKNEFELNNNPEKKGAKYWQIVNKIPQNQRFSYYAGSAFNSANMPDLKYGFDTGKNDTIQSITYVGTGSEQSVNIRTLNSNLIVNAPTDIVNHYSYAATLDLVAVHEKTSYHEYGTVGVAQVKAGHLVVESQGEINKIHIADNAADVEVKNIVTTPTITKESTVTSATVKVGTETKEMSTITNETITDFKQYSDDYKNSLVARIGSTAYPSLLEALNAALDGETVILTKNVEQVEGINFDRNGIEVNLDLDSHVFKVTSGSNASYRAFKIIGGTLNIKNGEIDARNPDAITSGTGNGLYGTIRIEPTPDKFAKSTLENLSLYNNHHFGLSVKVCTNGYAELKKCNIVSDVGGGIEADGGTAIIRDCTFTGTNGQLNTKYPWCAVAISVSGTEYGEFGPTGEDDAYADNPCHLGVVSVYNSEFTSTANYALYVFSSGGTLDIYSGKFTGINDVIRSQVDTNSYPYASANVNIRDGRFVGTITKDNKDVNVFNFVGGSFSVNPTAYCAEGYTAVQDSQGYWNVVTSNN